MAKAPFDLKCAYDNSIIAADVIRLAYRRAPNRITLVTPQSRRLGRRSASGAGQTFYNHYSQNNGIFEPSDGSLTKPIVT